MINHILKFLHLFALLLFLGGSVGIGAQDLRIVSDSKGRIGFSDADGNIVIKCTYTAALPFEDGLARVCKKDQWGMIDSLGNPILQIKYDEIYSLGGGVAKVRDKDKYGLIDQKGQWVLPPAYTHISPFNNNGLAWFATGKLKSDGKKLILSGGKVGIVSKNEGIKVEANYDGLAEFSSRPNDWMGYTTGAKILSCGLLDTLKTDCAFLAYDNDTRGPLISPGLIDGSTGQVIVKAGTYHKICRPVRGMMRFYARPGKNGTTAFGYYNLNSGKEIKCPVPDHSGGRGITHSEFVGDIALVISGQEKTADGKWSATGYTAIDKEGKTVNANIICAKFGFGKAPKTGYWAFFKKADGVQTCELTDENGSSFFLNTDYTDIIFPVADKEEDDDLFCVQKGSQWGIITKDGRIVVPFEWDKLLAPHHGVIYACKDNKWGLLLTDGSELIPPLYNEIAPGADRNSTNIFVRTDNKSWQNLKVGEAEPFHRNYLNIESFQDGFAWAHPVYFQPQDDFFNKIQKRMDGDSVLGYIINTNDAFAVPIPVAKKYMAQFRKVLNDKGKFLTQQQARQLILSLTTQFHNVKISTIAAEDEWDY